MSTDPLEMKPIHPTCDKLNNFIGVGPNRIAKPRFHLDRALVMFQ